MQFPETYIDQSDKSLLRIPMMAAPTIAAIKNTNTSATALTLTTGTTIVAMVSPDKKVGILASDGRASGLPVIVTENFCKVFDCRIGFIGGAGDVGLIQQIIPSFSLELNSICDARDESMTASGAKGKLFQYYRAIAAEFMKYNLPPMIGFLALFWDCYEEKIHLYKFEGLAVISEKNFACLGSGSPFADGKRDETIIPRTKEEMLLQIKKMLKKASEKDSATNKNIYYGLIENGEFTLPDKNFIEIESEAPHE